MYAMAMDAYAGINAFGANAPRYLGSVQEVVLSSRMTAGQHQENGTKMGNGPGAQGKKASRSEEREGKRYREPEYLAVEEDAQEWNSRPEYVLETVTSEEINDGIENAARMEPVKALRGNEFVTGGKNWFRM